MVLGLFRAGRQVSSLPAGRLGDRDEPEGDSNGCSRLVRGSRSVTRAAPHRDHARRRKSLELKAKPCTASGSVRAHVWAFWGTGEGCTFEWGDHGVREGCADEGERCPAGLIGAGAGQGWPKCTKGLSSHGKLVEVLAPARNATVGWNKCPTADASARTPRTHPWRRNPTVEGEYTGGAVMHLPFFARRVAVIADLRIFPTLKPCNVQH